MCVCGAAPGAGGGGGGGGLIPRSSLSARLAVKSRSHTDLVNIEHAQHTIDTIIILLQY